MKITNDKNRNSHLTVKDRKIPSLPVRLLFERNLLIGDILDFGCGLGKDVEFMQKNNFNAIGYDPFYNPVYPNKKFDTIICFYVLNILLPEEQTQVLMSISELLKPSGKAYFAVRRDIKRNGFIFNPKMNAETYQCNVILPYKSIFLNENMELYEYSHYTFLNKGKSEISPFFSNDELLELITESATAFAICAKSNCKTGNALIIPKRLVSDFFELTEKELYSCFMVLNRTKSIIQKGINPRGFSIEINIGEIAEQTVNHLHINLISKFKEECNKQTAE
jgi:diadenosine tetraphosphate (Ap4A) HIT family hydrolase